jgi:putative addiction module killer protein
MFSIKPLPEFTEWLDGLQDVAVRAVVVARIKRLERGLMGDVEPVGEGVSELRIHVGGGWRVYFVQRVLQVIGCWRADPSVPRKPTSSAPRHWQRGWID